MNRNTLLVAISALFLLGVGYYAINKTSGADTDVPTSTSQQAPVTSGENPQPGSTVHDLPVEPAAAVARKDLASKLGIEEKSIVILNIEQRTWSDGCLGLARADEFCSQALVDGFRVEMLAKGESYFYRTDATGANIRSEMK